MNNDTSLIYLIGFLAITLSLSLGISSNVVAQNLVVSGTVIDGETGEGMPGVNILVKGTSIGTTTDGGGNFELDVPSLSDTLVVSFIGYKTQIIPISGRTSFEITMQPKTVVGEELVITALGLEQESRSLSYSTESVGADELGDARELNVVNSLSGEVAGLSISQSSSGVGSSSRVILRGARSISGSSQPLYVVDGVPVQGDISNMSPNIIKNITVLKGANAAALYGSRAQNGVIIVTTKKGAKNEVNISISSSLQMRSPILLRQYQNKYGQGINGKYSPHTEYNWGPPMNGQEVDFWSPIPKLADKTYAFLPQPNNVRDAFQRGYNSSSNIIASVGGENTQVLFSYTFTNATGIVPGNALDRHNLNLRITSQLTDKLHLDSRLAYTRESIDNQLATGENFANPIRHIYRMPRNIRTEHAKNFEYFTEDGRRRQNFWNPGSNGGANPYWTMNRNLNLDEEQEVFALVSLSYDFTDHLNLRVRASLNGRNGNGWTKLYNDTYIIAQNGQYSIYKENAVEWNGDFLLSYKKDITDAWHINANVGGNIMQQRNNSLSANTGAALIVPNFFTITNTNNVNVDEGIGTPRDKYSLYGYMQIGWENTIYLDVTGRNDWSSTLPADSRSYFYPSVGLSVVLSDLIQLPEFISYAKLRGSWARVGSDAPPFHLKRTASLIPGGNARFLKLGTVLPAENLKPEETESIEVGLDLTLFNNRLDLGVTAYKTSTRNQLFQLQVPVGSGFSSVFTNGGNITNKGLEVTLSATPVQTNNFTWNINTNFSTNRNRVKEISAKQDQLVIDSGFIRKLIIEEGEPFGQLYSRGWERDDKGRVIVGADGIPLITKGFSVQVANYNSDWKAGFGSSFSYKNLSFSFLISHRQGGSLVSLANAVMMADGSLKKTLIGRKDGLVFGKDIFPEETAVLQDGSPNNIEVSPQRFWTSVGGRNDAAGEAFVESATNTRLREVVISYSLPQSILDGLLIENVQFSLVGRNLFFIYREADHIDPAIITNDSRTSVGFSSFTPPTTRTYGVSINIDF